MTDQQLGETRPKISKEMIYVAVTGGLLFVAFHVFFWDLVDFFSPFLIGYLIVIAWGIFLIFCLAALVHAGSEWRTQKWRSLLPMLILIIAIPLALLPPWTPLMLNLNFHLNRMQREKVVHRVLAGELKPKNSDQSNTIALPWYYHYLSKGGDIWIAKTTSSTQILFLTYSGVLDSCAGFLYCSDDTDPSDEIMGGQVIDMKQMGQNWYWVSYH